MEKAVCPYNNTHILNKVELEHHIKTCRDSAVLETFLCQVGTPATIQAPLAPSQSYAASSQDTGDDDWDAVTPGGSVLNSIKKAAEKKPILMGLTGASKAVRRDYKFQQRKRYQEMLNNADESGPVVQTTTKTPPSITKQEPTASVARANSNSGQLEHDAKLRNPSLSSELNNLTIDSKPLHSNAWGKPPVVKQDAEHIPPPVLNNQVRSASSSSNPWKTENNSAPTDFYNTSPQSPSSQKEPPGFTVNPAMGVWGRGNALNNSSSSYSANSSDFPSLLGVTGRGRKIKP